MTLKASGDRLRRAVWLCGLGPSELAALPADERENPSGPDVLRLRRLVVCPRCHGDLAWKESELECLACSTLYASVDGIPVLRSADSGANDAHKEQQASFFDSADPEFEITRPHGTPWLYRWLLGEKFRHSLKALPDTPATAVTICGGSGMDAEFLARTGATVVSTDISLGAAQRARERAARYGLTLLPVVADAEALPLADASVDLAYVHDGLHHLESPLAGLTEMARVARKAVSVNEPARAGATRFAIRLGLSVETEEAGNRVERVEPAAIVETLDQLGFAVVHCERYAMVYRHEPGRAARLLSLPPLRRPTRVALGLFNRFLGQVGNKLTVQAVRRTEPGSE
jgi:SAM-dependent methyltransferase